MREFTPRPYQRQAMEFLHDVPRCNLWMAPGMGKTSTVLTLLDLYREFAGEDRPTLVLGPLRVAREVWSTEVGKWAHLQGLAISVVVGTPTERRAALARQAHVYVTNYENLVWLVEELGRNWPFARVVADESTKLKSFRLRQGGQRAQALGRWAHSRVKSWVNLTGTPSPNGLKDLWGQQWFVDEGARLGRSFSAFENRWFAYQRAGQAAGYDPKIKPIILPGANTQIMGLLADCSLTVDPKDWFDLREPVVNVIEVELPKAARRSYAEMEREFFTKINGEKVEALAAAAKSMKLLQLANGAAYVTPEAGEEGPSRYVEVHDQKLQALDELLAEQGGNPVLLAYHFKSDRARILTSFPDAIDVATRDGLARAKRGEGRLWLGHPASMGHGVDGLQEHCHTACFFGHDWNLENWQQFVERIGPVRQLQSGKNRVVTLHYIVARNTIDELVMARRESKRSVQDLLLDYMKARKL